ncbi:unnamed protein product [Paramecium primaurelia]|uniref:Uncharacterized protein n=1 Tax=Paramecium primaurelia TaxID=5886 RepID=A0A8S1LUA2_PARPR|nr:unnamed protein product [Paramecium primaurelia]
MLKDKVRMELQIEIFLQIIINQNNFHLRSIKIQYIEKILKKKYLDNLKKQKRKNLKYIIMKLNS